MLDVNAKERGKDSRGRNRGVGRREREVREEQLENPKPHELW